ncbi:tetratricopeptide repeat protein [Aquimarina sp. ERC-38]|uniref:adenylate/guanylate cyclase domain-containing protein n=1 Tax=Aquimarina sp. ERC-38 TaxID=2949996 RepID=UPI002245E021|nr:adenylate/guanylate cyclase domain-containing protein [Aquimarina sp. ERC-38]UZO82165.1 tetratricopeptide repeat protein [Aquimarina sp. ERC-38]
MKTDHNITSYLYKKYPVFWMLFLFISTIPFATVNCNSIFDNEALETFLSENSFLKKEEKAQQLQICGIEAMQNLKYETAFYYLNKSLELYIELGDSKNTGICYSKLGAVNYYQGNYHKSLIFFEKSKQQHHKISDYKGISSALNNQGAIHYHLGNYLKSLEHYKQSLQILNSLSQPKLQGSIVQNIGGIYLKIGDTENAMKYFQKAANLYNTIEDFKQQALIANAIGEIYRTHKDYQLAEEYFKQGLQYATLVNDLQTKIEIWYNYADWYGSQELWENAVNLYQKVYQHSVENKNPHFQGLSSVAIGNILRKKGEIKEGGKYCQAGLQIATELQELDLKRDACDCLYKIYKTLNYKDKALFYHEKSILFKDSLHLKKTANKALQMEFEKQMLLDSIVNINRRNELKQKHQKAIVKKEKQQYILITIAFIVLLLSGVIYSRLRFIKKSKAVLQIEKDRSESLLLNILPHDIAQELKQKGFVKAQDFEQTTVLFTDFKSFTKTASILKPQELVAEINTCFKAFDLIIERYHIEKIKTIGDAYMAAGGLPQPGPDAMKNTIFAALEMQTFIINRIKENKKNGLPAFEMRLGIHAGPIVAGIVGVKKFQYDVWGDTVNIASRMESNGAVGKVNVSESIYQHLKDEPDLQFEYRGKIEVKGKGKLKMYFVSL